MGAAHRGVVDREYSDSPDEDGFVEHPDGRSRRANGKLHEDDLDGFPEEWEDIPCKNGRNHKEDDWHNEDDLDGSPDEREDPRHNHGGNHAENGWHDEDELDGSPKEPDEPVRNGASRFTKTETIDNSDDEISDVPTIDEEKAAAIHTYFRTQKYFNGHGDFPEGYEEAHINVVFERASLPSDGEGCINCEAFVGWLLSNAAPEALCMQLLAAQPKQAANDAPGTIVEEEQQLHDEFFDLIDQAFDHHDQMGSGVLDSVEGGAFFAHLMDVRGGFLSNLVAFGMYPRVKMMLQDRLQQDPGGGASSKGLPLGSGLAEEVERLRKSLSLQMASALESYIMNKTERDEALLQVISSVLDGTIHKEDLKEVLTPGSEKSVTLLRTFAPELTL